MVHVAVLGAAGGIGQPLSLLMKQDVRVTKLTLYDIVNTPGVAADLSHIDTPAVVIGYLPPDDGLKKTLVGADVVIIPAGVPRKPGMTRDDLFKVNAGIVRDLAKAIAIHAPDSYILVISNPVNSTVPIVAEEMKKEDVYEPRRLFGVTTLDVLRGSTFTADAIGDISRAPRISVPVLGGHSGATILPVVSQCIPSFNNDLSEQQVADLIKRIQYGGDEVVKAKDGAGSATLSMAYAGAKFASKLIYSWFTTDDQITQSYVDLDGDEQGGRHVRRELDKYNGEKLKTPMQFFSVTIKLGIDGVKQILPIGDLSDYEVGILKTAIPELQESIAKGAEFITKAPKL